MISTTHNSYTLCYTEGMALTRAGFVKTSLTAFPGTTAAAIFLPGCNFRCPYCEAAEFVDPTPDTRLIPIPDLLRDLERRRTMLGGVCITGGEPLIHEDIGVLVDAIRSLGLLVKIDTNGSFPRLLRKLNVDYIAMDIKTVPWHYNRVTPDADDRLEHDIMTSIRIVQESRVPHEFRIVLAPGIVTPDDIEVIAGLLKPDDPLALIRYRPGIHLDPGFSDKPYPEDLEREMLEVAQRKCIHARLRIG
jgi:pyruvate formate lyase activating enzyme